LEEVGGGEPAQRVGEQTHHYIIEQKCTPL
jgi:hypothetical protein